MLKLIADFSVNCPFLFPNFAPTWWKKLGSQAATSSASETLAVIAGKPNECDITMKIIRPKIIGTLKIEVMMAGNLAVKNDIKSSPNKIIVQCRSYEHGEEIITRIKESKPGDVLHL